MKNYYTAFICLPGKTKDFYIYSSCPKVIEILISVYGIYCCTTSHGDRESAIITVENLYNDLYEVICEDPRIAYKKTTKDPIQEIKKIILENPFMDQNTIVFHGAAVKKNKGAYMFLAPTHGGKTTLTSFLSNKGYCYISEDCIIVDVRDLNIIPCTTPIHLRTGGVRVLEKCGIINDYLKIRTQNVERYVYLPQQISKTNETIDAIFLLDRTTDINKIESLQKTQSINLLLKSLMYPPKFNSELFSFLNRLTRVNIFHLSYCDMEYVDNVLKKL